MSIEDQNILAFLETQRRNHGAHAEIEPGLWLLFAVPAADAETNALAQALLDQATFAHGSGASEDDRWTIYYVDTANRLPAMHWMEDLHALKAGEVRPVSPAHRGLIRELAGSNMPHRIAQKLVELHGRNELCAGAVSEPDVMRALLDRLHVANPLFYSAFHSLLTHHLLDMIVLHRQLIPEDVDMANEVVLGGVSGDPFVQSRQDAGTQIRNALIRFHVINPLDQQKNTALTNPYAAYLDLVREGDRIKASIDGTVTALSPANFVRAIRATRRNLYRGGEFERFNTQVPWMEEEIAYSFRFIKQRLGSRRDLSPMDGLYMLERAMEA
jgi:hypothetical protein